MAHENGDEQRQTKSRHVQGMLDETDPLIAARREKTRKAKPASIAEAKLCT